MPGFSPEQTDSITATWKKRKRDHEESKALACPTTFVSSPFRVDRSEYDSGCSLPLSRHADGADNPFRPRCLPRKRRHIQSPYLALAAHQHQHQYQPSHNHLSPNTYSTTNRDPYSPPVSPKTFMPLHYQTRQSTSASALRPCHICHRRPTTRQVLNAYADCDICRERACFICLRQCDSVTCSGTFERPTDAEMHLQMSGNEDAYDASKMPRRKICSSCAVEDVTPTGEEIVRCLDCARGLDSAWTATALPSAWALEDMTD